MSELNSSIPGLPVIFEDDSVIVVDKPSGMLSQPGKTVSDSVVTRVMQFRPEADGPVLVHRLDMDTSGLLVMAKNRVAHRLLQQQFEHRRIGKRYIARLCMAPQALGGRVHLPLRGDMDDRPRQIVCQAHGKQSTTIWHRFSASDPLCVWLYPLTGRTHQLRVHMAHPDGLGVAIQGDRLYQAHYPSSNNHNASAPSESAEPPQEPACGRLMLHAQYLAFDHPETGVRLNFQTPARFFENEQK
ncbi:RluA family pseudouridine synthase [Granulosicoccus antarcticus]|uniref:RluA family pseudouridine synthase n=1 Tax=Granulosicoccus antarcticus TaxID=437505 RepID=UPI0012FE37AB|nr:RluA family pseudouridine synthase [Granulosicoccus antarcticus]